MTPTSCPNCDAQVPVLARECSRCGFRLLEDGWSGRRGPEDGPRGRGARSGAGAHGPRLVAGAVAAAVVALAVAAALLLSGGGSGDGTPAEARGERPGPEVLSPSPLTDGEAERRLEARFTSNADDDAAAATCPPRDPRPAHAVRRCEVRYPNGTALTVLVVTSARGAELLGRIFRD